MLNQNAKLKGGVAVGVGESAAPLAIPVDSIYGWYQAHDNGVFYGVKDQSALNVWAKTAPSGRDLVDTYTFDPAWQITHTVVLSDGSLIVQIREGTLVYGDLYRSTDKGATFNKVLEMGKYDGVRQAGCRLLSDRAICDAGGGVLFAVLYNVSDTVGGVTRTPGGLNDRISVYKSGDYGATWEIIADFNQGARHIRHFHCIRKDPYTGKFYIGMGDANAESYVIEWDGVSPWQSNTLPSVYAAGSITGFRAVGGEQRFRWVDALFTQDAIYSFTDAAPDQRGAEENNGIWKLSKDLQSYTRSDSSVLKFQKRSGFYGLILPNGTQVWVDGQEGAQTGDHFISVYASRDGENWSAIGRLNTAPTTTQKIVTSFLNVGNRVYVTAQNTTGKSSRETIVFDVSETEDFDKRSGRPDTLHPCYWIDAVNGVDDANPRRGYQPSLPWRTISAAMAAGKATYAARFLLAPTADYELSAFTPDLSGATIQGDSAAPIVISTNPTATSSARFKLASGGVGFSAITMQTRDVRLELDNVVGLTEKTGGTNVFEAASTGTTIKEVTLVNGAQLVNLTGAGQIFRGRQGSSLDVKEGCSLNGGAGGVTCFDGTATGLWTLKTALNTAIIGGANAVKHAGGGTVEIKGTMFGQVGWIYDIIAGATSKPKMSGALLTNRSGSGTLRDNAALSWAGELVNCTFGTAPSVSASAIVNGTVDYSARPIDPVNGNFLKA